MQASISREARMRYRQRIKPNVDSARQAIRADLQRGRAVDTDRVTNAVAVASDEALYVLDENKSVVKTVLRRYDA